MELNIEWTDIRNTNLIRYKHYFVMRTPDGGTGAGRFCTAYWTGREWKSANLIPVPFHVTHVCSIDKVDHILLPSAYAIGDRVEILTSIDDYKEYSIGEVVGKYDRAHTWAIRMEDRFVILMADQYFRHYHSGGENA